MMKAVCAAVVATLLGTTSAMAADVTTPPEYDWTGGYVGVDLGAAMNNSHWYGASATPPSNTPFNLDATGIAAGGVVGFRYQMSNVVLGIEGSGDWVGVDAEGDCAGVFPTCVDKTHFLGMVQGNLGFAFDRLHVYGTGGVAFGNFEHYEFDSTDQTWGSESRVGWTAGAGLDYAVSDHFTAGVRWNYYDFGTKTLTNQSNVFPIDFTERGNLITARLEYKF